MRSSLIAAFVMFFIGAVTLVPRSSPSPGGSSRHAVAAPVISPGDLSCEMPSNVVEPTPEENPEIKFDQYAWNAFVALICTADKNQRGVAASPPSLSAGPRVFETYKSSWEIYPSSKKFPSNPPTPVDWKHYGGADFNPCGEQVSAGQLTLGSVSKFADVAQAGPSTDPQGPIVARNSTYVHYLSQFNESAFETIRRNSLYLQSGAATAANFPVGSIALKSAWVETRGLPDQEKQRYYRTMAWVQSPVADDHGSCAYEEVALVALHIVQKTQTRPSRIWASFEHEDNVPPFQASGDPPASGAPRGTYLFYDPAKGPMPTWNPLQDEPYSKAPPPFNIQSLRPRSTAKNGVDKAYSCALRAKLGNDTPWSHYRISVVQRCDIPNCMNEAVTPGPYSPWSWANPVAETFFQLKPEGTCIACHGLAKNDYVWSPQVDAYPDSLRNLRLGAFHTLESILESPSVNLATRP